MKFGKKLIEQASPQWADAYLPYKSLKETIKLFQGAGPATNKAEGGRALKFPLTHSCKATGIEPPQPARANLSSLVSHSASPPRTSRSGGKAFPFETTSFAC